MHPLPEPDGGCHETTDGTSARGGSTRWRTWPAAGTYLVHGTLDPTVVRPVADHLAAHYRHYGVPLTYRDRLAAGHGWITARGPVACGETAPPYLDDCSPYDAQADALATMLGPVTAPDRGAPRGMLRTFDQDRYAVAPQPGNADVARPAGRRSAWAAPAT